MPIPAFVAALAGAIALAVVKKSAEKATDATLTPVADEVKDSVARRLKKGKYKSIQRALDGARDDVLSQCQSQEQRRVVSDILDALRKSKAGSLLEEFSLQVTQTYLLSSPTSSQTLTVARTYRKVCGPAAIVKGQVLDETALVEILNSFFHSFYERLLREPDFSYLREYAHLGEARQQTVLQQAMLDKLAAIARNTAHEVTDFSRVEKEYRNYLINELKDHSLRGFAPQVGSRVLSLPLAKIFLPLRAVEGRPALAQYAEEDLKLQVVAGEIPGELDWQRRLEQMEKRYAQMKAREAAQRPLFLSDLLKNSRSVLLGDPGSGKTTVTRYITYAIAAGDVAHVGAAVLGLIPVLVRIANYAKAYERNPTLDPFEYIEKELVPKDELGHFLSHSIEEGRCLIIFDGLDEVTNPSLRIQVTERIQEMVATFGNNQYMVTSRIVGYDLSPLTREFKHATLSELSHEDRERFVNLWYDAIHSEISEIAQTEGASALIDALRTKPQIARMAANPLLLTIMVLMHWRGVKLPSRRVQVYQIATDTLIEYWTAQRGITELDAEEIKNILAPIAHYILSSNVGGVIAHQDLLPRFHNGIIEQRGCDPSEARRIGQKLLKDLSEQSGLFLERGRDVNDQPVYGFLHQTFGEYLAALHLAQEILSGRFVLSGYIHRSIWHEPMLLLAGHLSIFSPTHANALLSDIRSFPAPYEDVLKRNALLAADCLADDVQIRPDLRDGVLEDLSHLLRHPVTQVRHAVLDCYQRLAVTRHRDAATIILERVYSSDFEPGFKPASLRTSLDLAVTLVMLGEEEKADHVLQQLEKLPIERISGYQWEIQRLRVEGWPEGAVDYLLRLQSDTKSGFSINAGPDLATCMIGPIDAHSIVELIGDIQFNSLLGSLQRQTDDNFSKAALRWIGILASDERAVPDIKRLISSETPSEVRRLAAAYLLNSEEGASAAEVLQDLVRWSSDQASQAAQVLLEHGMTEHVEWQQIYDLALIADRDGALFAIDTLLQSRQSNIGLPAAIHFLAMPPTGYYYNRDGHLYEIVDKLMMHGFHKVGLAAAWWLALRPGYDYRLDACEILLEAGEIEQAVQALQYLAYQCHDDACQQACRRLLILREAERVFPILVRAAQMSEPDLRYQACLALAMTNVAIPNRESDPFAGRAELRLSTAAEYWRTYQTALNEFCTACLEELDSLIPADEYSRAMQDLARISVKSILDPSISINTIDVLATHSYPVIRLNAALLYLKMGKVDRAHQILSEILGKSDLEVTAIVKQRAIEAIGLVANSETASLLLGMLSKPDPYVRRLAVIALGQVGDALAVQPMMTALSDSDSIVRFTAADTLGELGDVSAVAPLVVALSDEDSNVRDSAARALGQLDDASAIPLLLAALSDEESIVRRAAADALGQLGDASAISTLLAALSDEHSNVRWSVVRALGQLGDASAIPSLLATLSDEESIVRRAAARALRQLGYVSPVSSLLTMLSDVDSSVRQAAADTLGLLGDASVVMPLIAALSDEESIVRRAAADALGELGDVSAVAPLVVALSDKDSNVRDSAARALGQLDDTSAIPSLLAAFRDDEDNVRESVVDALGALGDASVMPTLLVALSDEESGVRWSAARALGQLDDASAIPSLLAALGDEAESVRDSVADALAELGARSAVQPLFAALCDDDDSVRASAIRALGKLGDVSALPSLVMALSDNSSNVRRSAASALGRFESNELSVIIQALSAVSNSWDAAAYTRSLIHLDPARSLIMLDHYANQFKRATWLERFRGHAFLRLGNLESAVRCYHKALEAGKDKQGTLLALCHYYVEQGDLTTAQEYLDQAVADKPSAVGFLTRAILLWLQDRSADWRESLNIACKISRNVARPENLRYAEFWGTKAIVALESMLHEA